MTIEFAGIRGAHFHSGADRSAVSPESPFTVGPSGANDDSAAEGASGDTGGTADAADPVEEALKKIDGDTNKQDHILADKHDWDKVVTTEDWSSVRDVMKNVLNNGTESDYGSAKKKELEVNGLTVVVTFTYGTNGEILISDGWVKK